MVDHLAVAAGIGERIVATSLWDRGRCTWMGATRPPSSPASLTPPVTRPLGPDLYEGSSGIALFLAYLYAATRDPAVRRAADGAIAHALSQAPAIPASRACSLYTGALGVAVVMAKAAALLERDDLRTQAAGLGAVASGAVASVAGADLIAGRAGAIAGFLDLWRALGADSHLMSAVVAAGSIPAPAPPLTGMAHGWAGGVYALMELWAVTGDSRHRDAAIRWANHEDRWFDAAAANWLDLREAREPGDLGARSGIAWCHGAPGIVLSRRRLADVGGDQRRSCEAGIATTRRWIRAAVDTGRANFSLCHGLTGNVEALTERAATVEEGAEGSRRLADEVAALGAAEYADGAAPWPCGVPDGDTPSLMTGLAGIGLFYLRMHDPGIDSVLTLGGSVSARHVGPR